MDIAAVAVDGKVRSECYVRREEPVKPHALVERRSGEPAVGRGVIGEELDGACLVQHVGAEWVTEQALREAEGHSIGAADVILTALREYPESTGNEQECRERQQQDPHAHGVVHLVWPRELDRPGPLSHRAGPGCREGARDPTAPSRCCLSLVGRCVYSPLRRV